VLVNITLKSNILVMFNILIMFKINEVLGMAPILILH